ncbi:hypothetical protein MSAN_00802600 [Mycena sanguinolenta]|uniref:Uncharacterized protein n=1 Tax=Mycena sanguinolenta TaxID=230812 RepID=A0A8H6Z123_9AGAR|nr:hypothetical protein MSAN_00802600 [Mycena sanguinolenta]
MTTLSIDVAAIFREIRLTVTEIKNGIAAANEKKKAAQLLVYRTLSLHPALDQMRPPTGMLADVDWYTELRSTFTAGIFRRLGQNEHFKKMALLGDIGTRARIMLLLLWIIGHRLQDGNHGLEEEVAQLTSVKDVLVSLRKMIKTKLPLPPDRNPFQGRDYSAEDEDKALPRSELWGYALPENLRYEYDVRLNPTLLLHHLPVKTIIPQTKLTILVIQWASCNFGLGKKVYSEEEIDMEAFWNADPPPPDHDDDEDRFSVSSFSSFSSAGSKFEAFEGLSCPHYEAMWDGPTEDWVHSRFCSVYAMHGWAHQSFVRVLLFNVFCRTQTLPTTAQILDAVHVADRLCGHRLRDVWRYAEQFIIARALLDWKTRNATNPWNPVYSSLSPEERSKMVIFVDALRWDEAQPWNDTDLVPLLSNAREFLMNPLRVCKDAPDILSLPEISSRDTHSSLNVLPDLDPKACVCGECALIQSQLPTSLESFRFQYFVITSRPNHCDVLAKTWEPMIAAAEVWLNDLVSRIECNFALFPDVDRRMGPAVLEIANAMGIAVGSPLSDQQLLRLCVVLYIITDDCAFSHPETSSDREDYRVEDGPNSDRVLLVHSAWMYDMVGTEGLTLLHEREGLKIVYNINTIIRPKCSAICMPHFKGDSVSLFPARISSMPTDPSTSSAVDEEMDITLVLSSFQTDAFPLLSVCSPTGFDAPPSAVAALIRVNFLGRVIETVWKPDVKQGAPCDHTALWGQATRSSPTAIELILRVLPPSDASLKALATVDIERAFVRAKNSSAGSQLVREMLDELSRRVGPLTQAGSPLERTRACIVRCGAKDGPVDAIVVLAASLKKNVYVLDRR